VTSINPPGRSVVVAPYDPAWSRRAGQLAAEFRTVLAPHAKRIEHIGSTAIPGMAAKPVYDFQVSVTDLAAAAPAFDTALTGYGLTRAPWEHDHVPAWSDDPPELWAKRLWSKALPGGERINLHCRLVGSPNERLALLFRDWLRAHPMAVAAYAQFKWTLAQTVTDLETYTDIKDPVVDLVIAAAQEWAALTAWEPR